jgi:hypothetical protein
MIAPRSRPRPRSFPHAEKVGTKGPTSLVASIDATMPRVGRAFMRGRRRTARSSQRRAASCAPLRRGTRRAPSRRHGQNDVDDKVDNDDGQDGEANCNCESHEIISLMSMGARREPMLTRPTARRIASNIANLPTFLAAQSHEEWKSPRRESSGAFRGTVRIGAAGDEGRGELLR